MEIQFQQQQQQKKGKMSSKFKAKNNGNNSKFVGVRQRPSGRWVAEIKDTTQKIRMWLGTFETAEAAARAYDEAACLLRGSNTRTNFVTRVSQNSPLASRIRNLLNNKKSNEKKISLGTNSTSTNSSTSTASTKTTSITCTNTPSTSNTSNSTGLTNGNSTTSSPTSSHGDFSFDEKVNDHSQLFDDAYKPELGHCNDDFNLKVDDDPSQLFDGAYKPDLSHCNNDFDLSSSCHSNNMPWGYGKSTMIDRLPFAQEFFDLPKNVSLMPETEMEFSEFDRMKVERQISASLYAMNGVHEYMETIHEANEAIWDLPPLCPLFC